MTFLAYLSLLLILGVVAQWAAWRLKLPSILLLLVFGFALSQFTGTRVDDYLANESALLRLVGFFVAIILFEGGLTLKISELKEAGTPVFRLCTVGVVIAFGLTTVAAQEFQHHFGKAKVWQIAPQDIDAHHSKVVANHMRGRFCFFGGPKLRDLGLLVGKGAAMKATQLTEKFTLEDFREMHNEDALILFQSDEGKGLRPVMADAEDIEGPTTILSLVLEKEDPTPAG